MRSGGECGNVERGKSRHSCGWAVVWLLLGGMAFAGPLIPEKPDHPLNLSEYLTGCRPDIVCASSRIGKRPSAVRDGNDTTPNPIKKETEKKKETQRAVHQ